MLFTEEDIEHLSYFNSFAEVLNTYYSFIMDNDKIRLKFEFLVGGNKAFFYKLSQSIFLLDSFDIGSDSKELEFKNMINSSEYSLKSNLSMFYSDYSDTIMPDSVVDFTIRTFVFSLKEFFENCKEWADDNDKLILFFGNVDFVSLYEDLKSVFSIINLSDKTKSEDLVNKFVVFDNRLKNVESKYFDIENFVITQTNVFIENYKKKFELEIDEIIKTFKEKIYIYQSQYENNLKSEVESLSAQISHTKNSFEAICKDSEDLKKLINLKGAQLVTDHYSNKAKEEKIIYWGATIATISIIFFSIFLAMSSLKEYRESTDIPVTSLLETYSIQTVDRVEQIYNIAQRNALIYLILRLIISILIFSSIIYTSRVAYRAYIHMRHSENMMLKLATLRPFINQLKEEDRNQIHKDLVPDFFGKDAGMIDTTNEKFKDLPTNVSALAAKAIEQVGNNIGVKSSTEKNDKKSEGGAE